MAERYADVIVDISHEKVDRPFQYRIPQELGQTVYPGVRVHVPFGKGNRDKVGYVVDVSDRADYPADKIKSITAVDEKGVTALSAQIRIAYWLKRQYGSTTIAALKTVLPVKQKLRQLEQKKVTRLPDADKLRAAACVCEEKHQTAKARVLRALAEEEVLPYELIRRKLNVAPSTMQALEKQGFLAIETESVYRNPVKHMDTKERRVVLSSAQSAIVEDVMQDYRAHLLCCFLQIGQY